MVGCRIGCEEGEPKYRFQINSYILILYLTSNGFDKYLLFIFITKIVENCKIAIVFNILIRLLSSSFILFSCLFICSSLLIGFCLSSNTIMLQFNGRIIISLRPFGIVKHLFHFRTTCIEWSIIRILLRHNIIINQRILVFAKLQIEFGTIH